MILGSLEKILIKILEAGIPPKKNKEHSGSNLILLGQAAQLYNPQRREKVYLTLKDFLKNWYIIGGTGTGKTMTIELLVRQLILALISFGILESHGDLSDHILDFLAYLAVHSDQNAFLEYINQKLVLIEPSNQSGIIAFNPLEARPGESFYLAGELMGIFKKTWRDAWGPRMEELMRSTLVTLSENGLTLLEVTPLLTNPVFRKKLVQKLEPGEVRDYWLNRYNALSEKMQAVYREPILNRISIFTADPNIRLMVGQQKSTINFRKIMDEGKWPIINLSKGHLRENINLIAGLIIAKLKMAAMSRIDLPEKDRTLFIMFTDEFQNFAGKEDFETILSEARKHGLILCLVHQFLEQIDFDLRSAILGNTVNQLYFRMSHHNASQISSEIDPKEKALVEKRLIDFKVGEAYFKKKGEKARIIQTAHVPEIKRNGEMVQRIKDISFSKYARPKSEIEEEIQKRQARYFTGVDPHRPETGNRASLSQYEGELGEEWND